MLLSRLSAPTNHHVYYVITQKLFFRHRPVDIILDPLALQSDVFYIIFLRDKLFQIYSQLFVVSYPRMVSQSLL